MEQQVRVRRILEDGTAELIHVRESACSGDCHKCSGCGAATETVTVIAVDPIGVRPGDLVVIRTDSGPVLRSAAVLYMLPLVLFFLGYGLGNAWGLGALVGCLGFLAGIGAAVWYDRAAAKKKTVYTITGYADIPEKRGS